MFLYINTFLWLCKKLTSFCCSPSMCVVHQFDVSRARSTPLTRHHVQHFYRFNTLASFHAAPASHFSHKTLRLSDLCCIVYICVALFTHQNGADNPQCTADYVTWQKPIPHKVDRALKSYPSNVTAHSQVPVKAFTDDVTVIVTSIPEGRWILEYLVGLNQAARMEF